MSRVIGALRAWQQTVRSWPLARKILVINSIGAFATWALVIAIILLDQYGLVRQALLDEAARLADRASHQLEQPPVNGRSARNPDVVSELRAHKDVQAVALYDMHGELLMGTARAMSVPLSLNEVPEHSANPASNSLLASRAFDASPKHRGTVVVWLDPDTMHRRAFEAAYPFMAIAGAGALCVVLLVWLVLPMTLRRLGRLRHVVAEVTDQGNYAVRADIPGEDEIGQLSQAFNTMLDQIQSRDATLRTELEERQRAQKQSAYLASHDAATGLPNRRFFGDALADALAHPDKSGIAVLLIDIDNFKLVNDSLGHRAGDQLLAEIGSRLRNQIADQGLVCRVGGDEFAVILEFIKDEAQGEELGRQVLRALSRPVWINGTELNPGASAGIALAKSDSQAEHLMRNADTAMHQAKTSGRGLVRVFRAYMNDRVQHRLALEQDLRKALEQDQLSLHYQPQIDTASGAIVGVEALMRWQHPRYGAVSPVQFIPIAEDSGLVVPLGAWALRKACTDAQNWQSQGLPGVCVSVNVSARQFVEPNFVATVLGALFQSGLSGELLELELTESLLFDQHGNGKKSLDALHERGIALAIDDFGTGYSSLAYLKRFPLQRLKIDRSFIKNVPDSTDDMAISGAMIALGHKLGMQIVAEGVENRAQYNFLVDQACDRIQGYLFSKPIPLEELLAQWALPDASARVVEDQLDRSRLTA